MALSNRDKQGAWLIAAVVAVLIALISAKLWLGSKPSPDANNCVAPILANTAIVLDHSEAISEQTRREIIARAMAHIKDNVKENERVSVFTVSELSKRSLIPVVSLCKPPDSANR